MHIWLKHVFHSSLYLGSINRWCSFARHKSRHSLAATKELEFTYCLASLFYLSNSLVSVSVCLSVPANRLLHGAAIYSLKPLKQILQRKVISSKEISISIIRCINAYEITVFLTLVLAIL